MIAFLFYGLLSFIPLILWPYTSEVFEFNKMVLVYTATTIIVAVWLSRCLAARKFIFHRTPLDIPLLIFLAALTLSTVFSIDVRTSILGYYSRFHGGLASYLSYSLLYWAYVSNMDSEKTRKSIKILLTSAVLVSIYGILQHFGIDKNVWIQDVQNRIFSTLGQPNWLAAWIVALIPITWAFALNTKFWKWTWLSALFFIVLLFTKSRSGLLGFLVADVIFWSAAFWQLKRQALSSFIIHNSLFIILALAIGTPWTPKIPDTRYQILSNAPALETGGTESGEIRKIVWKGTIDLWKHYPLVGSGPETFAYSYYETRPVEHNLVSEWDFLYNKAHNEYLNFLATTGILGLVAYLVLIGAMIWQTIKESGIGNQVLGRNQNSKPLFLIRYSLFAGYASILVTNFFGFSVVPVAILFFMFPAMSATLADSEKRKADSLNKKLELFQKVGFFFLLLSIAYTLYAISHYWYADYLYAKGKSLNDSENYSDARSFLVSTVKASPNEAVFWSELSRATSSLPEINSEIAGVAVSEGQKAVSLSPRNLNLRRNLAAIYLRLVGKDPNYLIAAKKVTEEAVSYAPTDAKLYYNLALTTYRLGQTQEALELFDKTIGLKANYKNARFAKALILIELGRQSEAKEELAYILEKIDPNDNLAREELKKL